MKSPRDRTDAGGGVVGKKVFIFSGLEIAISSNDYMQTVPEQLK